MHFNTNTLYLQVNNGYEWCSIKYNNTESQLNYLSFNDLSLLTPSFHNRKFNYQYTDTEKPTFVTFSINPYSTLKLLFKQSDTIIFNETINNTSSEHISTNIDITNDVKADFTDLDITSNKIDSSHPINYTCSFSFISKLLENFISNYEYFTLELEYNTLNTFRLKSSLIPTSLRYNNVFNSSLTNIQLINGQKPHIDENKLYRKDIQKIFYDRYNKSFKRNYYNKLYELYYNNSIQKLKLRFLKNLLNNQNQYIPSLLKPDILLSDLSNIYYNYSTRSFQKNK